MTTQPTVAGATLPDTVQAVIESVRARPTFLGRQNVFQDCAFKAGSVPEGDVLVANADIDNDDAAPLEFYVVAKVQESDHFLHPDGTSILDRPDQKPPKSRHRLTLVKPTHDAALAAVDDFKAAADNLGALPSKMRKSGPTCHLPYGRDGNTSIVVQHKFMIEKTEEDPATVTDDDDDDDSEGYDTLFTVKGWPGSEGFHALAKPFENTHSIAPLPAFDEKGDLIMPQHYRTRLPGATVTAKLVFTSFYIGGLRRVISAQLQELHVLIPSARRPSAAAKRSAAILEGLAKRHKGTSGN
ncbi:hypothetical protein SCHPADRAFT_886213 [Schizopora paradoxa]|uniref:Uncharacterized protein n=1 Tax=Schizopora paradoxa TaxID=27342 RepID=A0A0H2S2H1_9AGAM|nr:hypothetical protein SCHPADRAFT_886213 [Schizopora paradoxa]